MASDATTITSSASPDATSHCFGLDGAAPHGRRSAADLSGPPGIRAMAAVDAPVVPVLPASTVVASTRQAAAFAEPGAHDPHARRPITPPGIFCSPPSQELDSHVPPFAPVTPHTASFASVSDSFGPPAAAEIMRRRRHRSTGPCVTASVSTGSCGRNDMNPAVQLSASGRRHFSPPPSRDDFSLALTSHTLAMVAPGV